MGNKYRYCSALLPSNKLRDLQAPAPITMLTKLHAILRNIQICPVLEHTQVYFLFSGTYSGWFSSVPQRLRHCTRRTLASNNLLNIEFVVSAALQNMGTSLSCVHVHMYIHAHPYKCCNKKEQLRNKKYKKDYL